MELRMYCAYNQTRECFLGLEVTAADFSYKALGREGALTIKPNQGLWLTPFRGIPDSGVTAPLDLIFLDKECRVIDLVESFPVISISSPVAGADTLLVVPAHSIFSSVTQIGDQFVLCVAEEMQRRLERLSCKGTDAGTTSSGALSIGKPLASGAPGLTALKERSEAEGRGSEAASEKPLPSEKGRFSFPINWLRRWWSPNDQRQAPRQPAPGVAAYYWDGLPPASHDVRDISSTGLYLLTEDRWYPGTLVLISLQHKDNSDDSLKHVIAVNVRAVRCDTDGVGLQFVLRSSQITQKDPYVKETDQKELEEFLLRLKKSND